MLFSKKRTEKARRYVKNQFPALSAVARAAIADIPSGAEQSQYRLFALHRAEHPDLIAKCPKCGEQIGITVLTPDAHPLIHTPIPFMGYVQA